MHGQRSGGGGLIAAFSLCVCSAGVGRTGVFITLSIVLERMRYEGAVDIFQTVKMLRTQRPAMVQTEVWTALVSTDWDVYFQLPRIYQEMFRFHPFLWKR